MGWWIVTIGWSAFIISLFTLEGKESSDVWETKIEMSKMQEKSKTQILLPR